MRRSDSPLSGADRAPAPADRGAWDEGWKGWWGEGWKGWWGEEPPYHAPVFVLAHRRRDPLPMEGG